MEEETTVISLAGAFMFIAALVVIAFVLLLGRGPG